ncbi:uncharacterized protein LOC135575983 isoform X2 [Columba livia]
MWDMMISTPRPLKKILKDLRKRLLVIDSMFPKGVISGSESPDMARKIQSLLPQVMGLLDYSNTEMKRKVLTFFCSVMGHLKREEARPTVEQLEEKLLPLFDDESSQLRELSICLFRERVQSVMVHNKKRIKSYVHRALLPLFFRLSDQSNNVAKVQISTLSTEAERGVLTAHRWPGHQGTGLLATGSLLQPIGRVLTDPARVAVEKLPWPFPPPAIAGLTGLSSSLWPPRREQAHPYGLLSCPCRCWVSSFEPQSLSPRAVPKRAPAVWARACRCPQRAGAPETKPRMGVRQVSLCRLWVPCPIFCCSAGRQGSPPWCSRAPEMEAAQTPSADSADMEDWRELGENSEGPG